MNAKINSLWESDPTVLPAMYAVHIPLQWDSVAYPERSGVVGRHIQKSIMKDRIEEIVKIKEDREEFVHVR